MTRYIADLHIHSSFSRATARGMTPELLAKTAKIKGVNMLGTGDIFHPTWRQQLQESLEPGARGVYRLDGVDFVLSGEVSFIYSKKGRVRKIHVLYLFPSFEDVERVVSGMGQFNLVSDGRPILGTDVADFTGFLLDKAPDAMVIPAHIWTPWFSVFGANSGFDSIEEAFGPTTSSITALETGLSSDPPMNWRVSQLDDFVLVSNSDAHSPDKIAREVNVFSGPLDYFELKTVLETKDTSKFLYTVEFYPQEGKYHFDGHRNCKVCFAPEQTEQHNRLCPVCGKPLTVGVMHRVEQLADRPPGYEPKGVPGFKSLIPLREVIGDVLGVGPGSKSVDRVYQKLVSGVGNELKVLLDADETTISRFSDSDIAKGVIAARNGQVEVEPGYDGQFGVIKLRLSKGPKMGSLF